MIGHNFMVAGVEESSGRNRMPFLIMGFLNIASRQQCWLMRRLIHGNGLIMMLTGYALKSVSAGVST
jgi:hypothetical protein